VGGAGRGWLYDGIYNQVSLYNHCGYLVTRGVGVLSMWIFLNAGDWTVDDPPVSRPESGLYMYENNLY